jgi:hypothetical protein
MAKAYWIASYRSIKDPEALDAYAKLAGPAIWAAGGRNLVRGTPAKTLEAGMDLRRPPGNCWVTASSATSVSWKALSSILQMGRAV